MASLTCLRQHGVPTLRQYLRGTWKLTRTMRHAETDALMGTVHDARATFRDVSSSSPPQQQQQQQQSVPLRQLLYREEGEVNFSPNRPDGKLFPFYREYMYTFTSSTQADVHFYQPKSKEAGDHMKFFHTLSIDKASGAGVTSEHLCINDLYLATMRIKSASAFEMSWRVTGPQKNYQIITHFARLKEDDNDDREMKEEEEASSVTDVIHNALSAVDDAGLMVREQERHIEK